MSDVTALLRITVKEEVTSQMAKAGKVMEGFKQQTSSTTGVVKDFFKAFAAPALVLATTAGIAKFVKESIGAASSLAGLERRAQAIYGDAFPG